MLRLRFAFSGYMPLAALSALALLLLVVVDDQSGLHVALMGIAVAALVAVGACESAVILPRNDVRGHRPAEERRLRGDFRRQHRPDSPGRPMPRAPGEGLLASPSAP